VGFVGCGGGGSAAPEDSATTVTVTVTVTEPSENGDDSSIQAAETIEMWKRNWCSTKLGMSREELVELMGEPNTTLVSGSDDELLHWSLYEWQFTAEMTLDGKAYVLKWQDASTPGVDTQLPCDGYRTP
jgi:hypothetical protein